MAHMTLADYLTSNRITYACFGRRIGTPYAKTVSRYAKGEQPPSPEMLRRIHEATSGAVTPNDFFDFVTISNEATASQEG